MANQLLGDDRKLAIHSLGTADQFPIDPGSDLRCASVNFTLEVFEYLRPALLHPHVLAGDLLSVFERQRIRKLRIRIRIRFVIRFRVA